MRPTRLNMEPFWFQQTLMYLLIMCAFSACVRDDLRNLDTSAWNPSLAISLVNTEYEVEDFLLSDLNNGLLESDSSGLVHLIYRGQIASVKGSEIFDFPDVPFITNDSNVVIDLSSSGHEIRQIGFNGGALNVNVSYSSLSATQVNLSIPGLTLNGVSYTASVNVPSSAGNQTNFNFIIALDGRSANLELVSGQESAFEIQVSAVRNSSGSDFTFLLVSGTLDEAEFRSIEGIFSSETVSTSIDTVRLDLFKNWTAGVVTFINPKIHLHFNNSFGIPLGVNLADLTFHDESDTIYLSGDIANDTIPLNYPENQGDSEETEVSVDVSNSEIDDALSFGPFLFGFDLNVFTLEAEDTINADFMLDESEITVDAELELPLRGTIVGVEVTDTFVLNVETLEFVTEADLRLVTDNHLAADLSLQVYFTDDQLNPLDSLFAQRAMILRSAEIDNNGYSIAASRKINRISLTENRLENFYAATKMLVKATVVSAENGSEVIRIQSDDQLTIKLGAIFKGEI